VTRDETAAALERIAGGLEALTGQTYRADGSCVVGPGTTSLVITDHPEIEVTERTAHLDVGFVLTSARDDATVWDCSSGFGASKADAVASAVDAWLQTTAPVVLELMTGQGTFADHYPSAETGLPGRHAIHGALLGWGIGDAARRCSSGGCRTRSCRCWGRPSDPTGGPRSQGFASSSARRTGRAPLR
jgi:hypothetical protein